MSPAAKLCEGNLRANSSCALSRDHQEIPIFYPSIERKLVARAREGAFDPKTQPRSRAMAATQSKQVRPRGSRGRFVSRVAVENRKCEECLSTQTTQWRSGLNGQSLCNACGIRINRRTTISLGNRPVSPRNRISKRRNSPPPSKVRRHDTTSPSSPFIAIVNVDVESHRVTPPALNRSVADRVKRDLQIRHSHQAPKGASCTPCIARKVSTAKVVREHIWLPLEAVAPVSSRRSTEAWGCSSSAVPILQERHSDGCAASLSDSFVRKTVEQKERRASAYSLKTILN